MIFNNSPIVSLSNFVYWRKKSSVGEGAGVLLIAKGGVCVESLEEKKELAEEKEKELGGFDLEEDIYLQMDFFEIMRSENNVR